MTGAELVFLSCTAVFNCSTALVSVEHPVQDEYDPCRQGSSDVGRWRTAEVSVLLDK